MENEKLNYLVESYIDNYIDNVLIQEVKLSSLHPKTLKSYADEVIDNSFNTVIQGTKTILKGGAIGGIVGVFVNIGKSLAKTLKFERKEASTWEKFTQWLGLSKPQEKPSILDRLSFNDFMENLKNRFQEGGGGPEIIGAGIFVGLSLALVHAIFIKKYNMSKDKAKKETLKMAKKASMKADKDTKKIINGVIDEYEKFKK